VQYFVARNIGWRGSRRIIGAFRRHGYDQAFLYISRRQGCKQAFSCPVRGDRRTFRRHGDGLRKANLGERATNRTDSALSWSRAASLPMMACRANEIARFSPLLSLGFVGHFGLPQLCCMPAWPRKLPFVASNRTILASEVRKFKFPALLSR